MKTFKIAFLLIFLTNLAQAQRIFYWKLKETITAR